MQKSLTGSEWSQTFQARALDAQRHKGANVFSCGECRVEVSLPEQMDCMEEGQNCKETEPLGEDTVNYARE